MRPGALAVLLVGVVLLPAGLLVTAESTAQEAQGKRALERDATQVSAAFTSYFERARSLDLLLAQNPAFRPADGSAAPKADVDRALSYLEKLYPGAIGEACLINESGTSWAASPRESSHPLPTCPPTEAANAFFIATLARNGGRCYQATPYVSADTHDWVISNSTWVPAGER